MTTIWQVIHDGGTVECQTEEHAKEQAAKLSGSRVVELAPVDPLERAVVEAGSEWVGSVGYCRMAEMVRLDGRLADFVRAVDALIAARKGA